MSGNRTEENLHKAFVGEAKATLRLQGFAEKADQEGYPQMARLFRAISAAERIHALKHLRLLRVIESTEDNLKKSFESETKISENVYPEFIRTAEEEEKEAARISFSHARDAESFHAKRYKGAIDHMVGGSETTYFVCQICGYVADGRAPENCPICNAPREKFLQVD